MKSLYQLFVILFAASFLSACHSNNASLSSDNIQSRINQLAAGDTLTIPNGTYNDVRLNINNAGTEEQNIVIRAEEAGKVIFSGKSIFNIGGTYCHVSGFLFTNGDSGKNPVVRFKTKSVANHCRLSNIAISNYNPSDRFLKNTWVELYGKNNRVDHCSFTGKLNSGVTLVVKLSGEENQKNFHSIDHNYFGPRPRLGSNGGETMRVGVSTYSLTSSNTQVKNNYFERCSGEVEIVSIKSSDNVIDGNTFYECEGVLTLRHGKRNLLQNNVFIGNNKEHTGGIRVINPGHTVKNNHFQELKGDRFRSALPVMNGVPNSAINRYHQVKDVKIINNVLINCDHITFGVGSDNERTAIPENVLFANNILYYPQSMTVYESLVSTKGITFKDNQFSTADKSFNQKGFKKLNVEFKKNDEGLYASVNYSPKQAANLSNTGAVWFTKNAKADASSEEHVLGVDNNIAEALSKAKNNDVIVLAEGAVYEIAEPLIIDKNISIKSASGTANKAVIKYKRNDGGMPLMIIKNGGSLNVESIVLDGASETSIAKAGICTQRDPMIEHYNVKALNVDFKNHNVNQGSAFYAFKSTYADTLWFEGCTFSNMSGIAINLSSENEDRGKYNVENVYIKNCLFTDIMASAIKLYRGGNDESTLGPFLTIDQCTFHNIENRELGSSLNLIGVQWITITNSIFSESGKSGRVIKLEDQNWIYCNINNVNFYKTGRFESFYDGRLGKKVTKLDPQYQDVENGNFALKASSPLLNKSSVNKRLGYLN